TSSAIFVACAACVAATSGVEVGVGVGVSVGVGVRVGSGVSVVVGTSVGVAVGFKPGIAPHPISNMDTIKTIYGKRFMFFLLLFYVRPFLPRRNDDSLPPLY